jgi:hypothetical protein
MKWKQFVVAVGVVAISLGAGGYGYAALTSTNNAYTGCLRGGAISKIKIGIKPTSACTTGSTQVSWNQQGQPGTNGTSITSTALAVGNSHCPHGGSSFTSASGTTYACSGLPGSSLGADIRNFVVPVSVPPNLSTCIAIVVISSDKGYVITQVDNDTNGNMHIAVGGCDDNNYVTADVSPGGQITLVPGVSVPPNSVLWLAGEAGSSGNVYVNGYNFTPSP